MKTIRLTKILNGRDKEISVTFNPGIIAYFHTNTDDKELTFVSLVTKESFMVKESQEEIEKKLASLESTGYTLPGKPAVKR